MEFFLKDYSDIFYNDSKVKQPQCEGIKSFFGRMLTFQIGNSCNKVERNFQRAFFCQTSTTPPFAMGKFYTCMFIIALDFDGTKRNDTNNKLPQQREKISVLRLLAFAREE